MKLLIISSEKLEKFLKRLGFVYAPKKGKGSHIAFYRTIHGRKKLVIIPKTKEIPKGIFLAILDQAGLSKEEFLKLWKESK